MPPKSDLFFFNNKFFHLVLNGLKNFFKIFKLGSLGNISSFLYNLLPLNYNTFALVFMLKETV